MAGVVVVLGGGSAGEAFVAALRRIDGDVPIALVERSLVGGECSYYACMPSKALLRPTEALSAARLAPGAAEAVTGELDPARVFWHRDQVTGSWDDSSQETYLEGLRVDLVRGEGRVTRPGTVTVGGRELPYEKLVIATGSAPLIPEIDGLADVEFWTSPDATSTSEIPESIVVLGAGPVGCELAQFFGRMGTRVVLVNHGDRLLTRIDQEAGALLADRFREEGIDLHLGARIDHVEPGVCVHFSDGDSIEAERLLVATGRKPNVDGFGLELLDLTVSRRGIEVDETLRAADNVWALGDVNGIAPFTHVGKYQARVAAANVAGRTARADYRAIPAVIFTDPQIASAGRGGGDGLVSSSWRIDRTARSSTYERPKRPGFVKVFADPERRVLVGAVAVGPEAGEWLGQLTLAIRAEVPVDVLRDTIQPSPTFSEALFFAVRDLPI
jgi:pyruvate/2-oxoglutarate dehydrogenase complex dihydrolipoamide dehydrogenase (E3) component